jgi:hypothetical protein
LVAVKHQPKRDDVLCPSSKSQVAIVE